MKHGISQASAIRHANVHFALRASASTTFQYARATRTSTSLSPFLATRMSSIAPLGKVTASQRKVKSREPATGEPYMAPDRLGFSFLESADSPRRAFHASSHFQLFSYAPSTLARN